MPDTMHIRDLKVRCIIGTRPVERRRRQTIVLNIAMECDFARVCRTDNLADTVNYQELRDRIETLVRDSRFFLIERLAAAVAEICISDRHVRTASVTVDKPGALSGAQSAAVTVARSRIRVNRHD